MSCQEQQVTVDTCSDAVDEVLFAQASTYLFPLPKNAFDERHPFDENVVQLGKELYFEKNLSLSKDVSCNTCHPLDMYGANDTPLSNGVFNQFGDRNAPSVYNAALHVSQFWDGRAKNVEEQIDGPLFNPKEMGMRSKKEVVDRISQIPKYEILFAQAYQSREINYEKMVTAIGAFERTLLTPSRLDVYLNGDYLALNTQEKRGLQTMLDVGCIPCHSGSTMGGALYQKFGIFEDYSVFLETKKDDLGRFQISQNDADMDVFKVPSLRNVTKTAPYFHDGSVSNLEDAIQIMAKLQLGQILEDQEVQDIMAFLAVSSDWL